MAAPRYQVQIADLNGVLQAEVPVRNLEFSFALNEPGGCGFVMDSQNPLCTKTILDPGKREIYILRDGTRVWGGYLWYANPTIGEGEVRFSGEGYLSRLNRRLIDSTLSYTATDQFDIGWNLIAFTQAKTGGSLGFTRFSATASGVARDRSYKSWEMVNIGQALTELAEVNNGFDFEITPTKQYKNYYPTKGAVLGQTFEFGKNISGLSLEIDAQSMANDISAMGAGDGANVCFATAVDTTSRSTFGLLEDVVSFTDVKNFSTLQDHATEELRIRKGARYQPQLAMVTDDPDIFSFVVGDTAIVKASLGYVNLNEAFRIVTIVVQLNDEGREVATLTFDGITT